VYPHEYRRVLAERAMAEEQAKLSKTGSFILQYHEQDIISEELLKKEAVSASLVVVLVRPFVCSCVSCRMNSNICN